MLSTLWNGWPTSPPLSAILICWSGLISHRSFTPPLQPPHPHPTQPHYNFFCISGNYAVDGVRLSICLIVINWTPACIFNSSVELTHYCRVDIHQRDRLAKLNSRLYSWSHYDQRNMGTSLKHGHLVELPVFHSQFSMVRGEEENCAI